MGCPATGTCRQRSSVMKSVPRLEAIAGNAPRRSPTVKVLASFAGHADCRLASVGMAARIDFDQLLAGTAFAVPFGQSPFAFARGTAFERSLSRNGYGPVLALLRERLGFEIQDARVVNLRAAYAPNKEGMRLRAHETRNLLREIVRRLPTAPNLIDGAVLEAEIGGVRAHFEADSLATRRGGVIYTGEVKSFPVVDGRADPEKLGAALDQASIYTLLNMRTVEAVGGDRTIVSPEALIITPRNVGLSPTLSIVNIASRVSRAEQLLAHAPNIRELAESVPRGLSFEAVAPSASDSDRRIDALHELADGVGTNYVHSCLSDCGLARFCRARAFAAGRPGLAGPQAVRMLPGVRSLGRAVELGAGAPPLPEERPVAELLHRAARHYDSRVQSLRAGGSRP
jgi:hypothetical protein